MRFHDAMTRITRLNSEGQHGAALAAARELTASLLRASRTDPEELGWARCYELRALYALGMHEEGLALLDVPAPRPSSIRPEHAAWMAMVGAELAAKARDADRVCRHAARALALRLEHGDGQGARETIEKARALLGELGAEERLSELLDVLDDLLAQAPPGAEEGERLSAVILAIEQTIWGRDARRRGARRDQMALHEAVRAGDEARVRDLLAAGASPNAIDGAAPGLLCPVLAAAFYGHAGILRRLIASGARVDVLNVQGRTALHLAADQGHAEAVALLAAAGAPLEARDLFGQTPLHLASWQDHGEATQHLLAARANPNALDTTGCTPLHLTASEPLPAQVMRLLDAGANVDARDHHGCTPLMHAAAEGRAECVDLLLAARARPELRDLEQRSAADYALMNGHLSLGRRLYAGRQVIDLRSRAAARSTR